MNRIFQWIRKWFPSSMYDDNSGRYILMEAEFHEYQCGNFEDDGSYAEDD